jgi:hypothetical protein
MRSRLYDGAVAEPPRRAAFNATGIVSVVAGAALFALVLWNVDASQVWEGVTKLRWWLLVVIALGGLRFLVRAIAWSACVEPPHRLAVADAFKGVVAGDTVGNATPLGPVLGEPAKVAYARGHVPFGVVLTALAIENLFYSLSAAAMIAAGTLALLFAFNPPAGMRLAGEVAVGVILLLFLAAMLVLWRRPAVLSRLLPLIPGKSATRADKVRALEQQIYTFARRRGGVVVSTLACELAFHALGVVEAYLTLSVINGTPPPLLSAFILETANRLFAALFKVVPFQLGIGELGNAAVTEVLGLGGTTGVTVAVVRKARMAAWALVGAALLAGRRGTAVPADPARRVH